MSRQWYPDFLIDEVLPESRDSAEAWLPYLLGDEADEDGEKIGRAREPGEAVCFQWFEHRGSTIFAVQADGTLSVPLRCTETSDMFGGKTITPPSLVTPDINAFWNDEHEIFGETPGEFARLYAEGALFTPLEAEDIEVSLGVWSDEITFTISPDGKSLIPATETDTHVQG